MKCLLLRLTLASSLSVAACSSDEHEGGTDSTSSPSEGSGSGGASAGSSGAASGGASAGGSAGNVCEERDVRSDRTPPDILIMLDRSLSMAAGRWLPSKRAVEEVTKTFDKSIRFGLMVFPGDGGAGCQAGEVYVPVDFGTASEVAGSLMGLSLVGFTPIDSSLKAAHKALLALTGTGPRYALLVTDGAPTCRNGIPSVSALGEADPVAVMRSEAELMAMARDGIKTFVVGYNTAPIAAALDRLAAAGQTKKHHAVGSGDELVKALENITGNALSCTFALDEAPEDPTFVRVQIDGKQLKLGDPDGFELAPSSPTVTIQGAACDLLRGPGSHDLKVQVLCEAISVE